MGIREEVSLHFTSENASARRGIRQLDGDVQELDRDMDRAGESGRRGMAKWVAGIGGALAGFLALRQASRFVSSSVQEFTQWERAMSEVWTITDWTADEMHRYGREVQDFAMRYGVDATQTAKSLYQVISAGIPEDSAMSVLGDAMKFAKVSLTEASSAVDLMTTVINAYGLAAEDAAMVSDVLFTTIRLGKTTGEELAETLGKVIPIASQAGVSLQDLSGAMVLLTRGGLGSAQAATALRGVLTAIAAPTLEAQKRIEELGLTSVFSAAKLREDGGLFEILSDLAAATEGDLQKMRLVVPEIEALVGALSATGQMDALPEILRQLAESTGAVDTAMGKMQGALFLQFERISSTWDVLKSKVGEGVAALITGDVQVFADSLQEFTTRLDEVGSVYQEALARGATEGEALRESWEALGNLWEDTIGPQVEGAVDALVKQLAAVPWEQLFVDGMTFAITLGLEAMWTVFVATMSELGRLWTDAWNAMWDFVKWRATEVANFILNTALGPVFQALRSLSEWGLNGLGSGTFSNGEQMLNSSEKGFQFGSTMVGGAGGVDRVPAWLTRGEAVVREPVARDPEVQAMLHAMNNTPANLHMHFPGVTSRATASQVAPAAASGFARFGSIGGMR